MESQRHGSPLHLHISAWKGGVGQCWALLGGPRPGRDEYRVREGQSQKILRREAGDAVAAFLSGLDGLRWEVDR